MLSMCCGAGLRSKATDDAPVKAPAKPGSGATDSTPANPAALPDKLASLKQRSSNGAAKESVRIERHDTAGAPEGRAAHSIDGSEVATSVLSNTSRHATIGESAGMSGSEPIDTAALYRGQTGSAATADSSARMNSPSRDGGQLDSRRTTSTVSEAVHPTKVLAPKYSTLDATLDFVCALVEHLGGRMTDSYTILHDHPVRKCMFCIQCQASTSAGTGGVARIVDVLFFPSEDDFKAQRRICNKRPLQDSQPRMEAAVPALDWLDRESGVLVKLPSHVITEPTIPMDDVLLHMDAVTRQATMFVIVRELAAQLVLLHGKRVVHRGITRGNVVQLSTNNSVTWTFREYCCYVTEGKVAPMDQSISQLLILPPESALAVRNMTKSLATPCMDIWQLGVLMCEMFSGVPYWPVGMSARDVVAALLTPGRLPHERDPAVVGAIGKDPAAASLIPKFKAVRALVERMLNRQEGARPDAVTVSKDLSFSALERTVADGTLNLPWSRGVVAIGS